MLSNLKIEEFCVKILQKPLKVAVHLPYSRKYWRSIKFGSLVVGEATIKFKSAKFKCDLRKYVYFTRARILYVRNYTAKFKSIHIFISATRDQTAKFNDRQYFRLYGIWFLYLNIWEKLSFHLKQQVICISHSFWAEEALNQDF